jgi:hypothetical protein
MRYTCDLMDQACVDRMNLYNALGLILTVVIIVSVYVGTHWWDSRKKKRRESGLDDFPDCIDRCDNLYRTRSYQLECYRNCAWHTFH